MVRKKKTEVYAEKYNISNTLLQKIFCFNVQLLFYFQKESILFIFFVKNVLIILKNKSYHIYDISYQLIFSGFSLIKYHSWGEKLVLRLRRFFSKVAYCNLGLITFLKLIVTTNNYPHDFHQNNSISISSYFEKLFQSCLLPAILTFPLIIRRQ